ncbi:hypothetical protein [Streptomyces sp. Tue6028]|uniref:hypothetical protein n=1 Tax=Streptomyces sp. Tue6028 TaxID=2036037 RepID=UPI003EBD0EC6
MPRTYQDRWIECTPEALRIRGYYFPWGTKRIPYATIRSVRRVAMSAFTGRGRIWGTANPLYWASLDPQRPEKSIGLILDIGRGVRPFITPDDPDAVESVICEHTGLSAAGEADLHGPML